MAMCSVCPTERRTHRIGETDGKLLLTEFNRILPQREILSLRIEENRQGAYGILAEIRNGEIVTIAVIEQRGVAKRLAQKLRKWLMSDSKDGFPFHTQYELNHILQA